MAYKVLDTISKDTKEMRTYYVDYMLEMGKANPNIVDVEADLMRAMNLFELKKQLPDQCIDCGIQEANMYSVSAGLASVGKIPFAHTFACFATRRGFDQIYLSCAYAGHNVKIVGSDPGITTEINGGTHMSFCDVSLMRNIPHMTIVEPTDSTMLKDMLTKAAETEGMFYLRLYRKKIPLVYEPGSTFEIGKAALVRDGKDVSVIANGMMVPEAIKAADILKEEGISVRIYDMFTIKPLDEEAVLAAAKETGAIVTAENHSVLGGMGSAVAECLMENGACVPFHRVGLPDEFGEVGKMDYLQPHFGISTDDLVKAIREVVAKKK